MTQQGSGPVGSQGAAGEGQSTGARSAGSRPCPGCGTPVNVNASVCPTCGESLPSRNKKIRCRQCHGTASADLVICPHCGRELQPAAPRLLTWGVPALLVLLFGAIFLARLGGANPITWAQQRVERAVAFVGSLGDRLQPEITVETIPVEEDIEDQLASAPAPAPTVNDAGQAQPPADATQSDAAPQEAAAVPPTETATATTEPTATTAPTATEAPTATAAPELPTATATATSVPPTATSLPATATTTVTLSVPRHGIAHGHHAQHRAGRGRVGDGHRHGHGDAECGRGAARPAHADAHGSRPDANATALHRARRRYALRAGAGQ